jgi:peroxiredoxin
MTILITMVAVGLFLLGGALIPLLINAQQKALEQVSPIFSPLTSDYPAPNLTLVDLQGNPTSLEQYRGLVVLVNNWATWCPPCRTEMPELQAYFSAHASQGFVVVAIESGDTSNQVSPFVGTLSLTFPVWLDLQGIALEKFQNWNLPSSYVIGRDGMIRLSWTGAINQSTLEHYVTPLLEEGK